ncbi:hypothetical protein [Butyrivibrio proteoclasticus]|uniref:hypothetical protein n=1 Tax=Butyrivibrio proteoclasticus TaxID=43305 RepID=UPI000478DCEA|nr:hypothetical protein [Butyrivibrio proteoclasticus]
MKINFVYPDMSADSFINVIDEFNGDIGKENLKTLIPRTLGRIFNYLIYVVYFVLIINVFKGLLFLITGRSENVIYLSLFIFIAVFGGLIFSLRPLGKCIRTLIIKGLRSHEFNESYSFSKYVVRKNSAKKKQKELNLYQMCDELKNSARIVDAAARCDGDMCKVEIKFVSDTGIERFYKFDFPYKLSEDTSDTIVDFTRELVIFPENMDLEENQ